MLNLKKREFKYNDFESLTQFANKIGKENVINIQMYDLNLNFVIFYWSTS